MTNLEPPIREMATLREREGEGGRKGGREERKEGRREGGREGRERVTITVHVFVCYIVCENTFIKNRQDLKTYMSFLYTLVFSLFLPRGFVTERQIYQIIPSHQACHQSLPLYHQ